MVRVILFIVINILVFWFIGRMIYKRRHSKIEVGIYVTGLLIHIAGARLYLMFLYHKFVSNPICYTDPLCQPETGMSAFFGYFFLAIAFCFYVTGLLLSKTLFDQER